MNKVKHSWKINQNDRFWIDSKLVSRTSNTRFSINTSVNLVEINIFIWWRTKKHAIRKNQRLFLWYPLFAIWMKVCSWLASCDWSRTDNKYLHFSKITLIINYYYKMVRCSSMSLLYGVLCTRTLNNNNNSWNKTPQIPITGVMEVILYFPFLVFSLQANRVEYVYSMNKVNFRVFTFWVRRSFAGNILAFSSFIRYFSISKPLEWSLPHGSVKDYWLFMNANQWLCWKTANNLDFMNIYSHSPNISFKMC